MNNNGNIKFVKRLKNFFLSIFKLSKFSNFPDISVITDELFISHGF